MLYKANQNLSMHTALPQEPWVHPGSYVCLSLLQVLITNKVCLDVGQPIYACPCQYKGTRGLDGSLALGFGLG